MGIGAGLKKGSDTVHTAEQKLMRFGGLTRDPVGELECCSCGNVIKVPDTSNGKLYGSAMWQFDVNGY